MDKKEFNARLNELLSSSAKENDDLGELIISQIIADMFRFSFGHMAECGDSTYISRILSVFERSKYFSVMLDWILDSTPVIHEVVGDAVVLKKVMDKPSTGATLTSHLQSRGPDSTLRDVIELARDAKKSNDDAKARKKAFKNKRRVIQVKKSSDLMDSRLMYAGNYGAGRRR